MKKALIRFLELARDGTRTPVRTTAAAPAQLLLPPEPGPVLERGPLSVDLRDPEYYDLTTMDLYYLRRFLEA